MSRASGSARAVLQVQPLRHYLAGQTLSAFGDSLMPIALVFAVLEHGGGAAAVGWVLLASRLPAIVLALLGGAISDRVDRRRVLLLTDVSRCLLQATCAALLLTGHAQLWALAGLQALSGTASALFTPAAAGLVRTLAPPALLTQANALQGLTRNTVSLAGLALAGALVATVGPGWAFALDAATFAASAAFLARLPGLPPSAAVTETLWRSAVHGVTETFRRRWLWTSIVYVATLNLVAVCPFLVLGPVIAQQQLGGAAAAWSTIALGYASGSIGGNALILRWSPPHPLRAAFLGALALIPLLCLLAAAAPVPVLVAAAALTPKTSRGPRRFTTGRLQGEPCRVGQVAEVARRSPVRLERGRDWPLRLLPAVTGLTTRGKMDRLSHRLSTPVVMRQSLAPHAALPPSSVAG